VGGPVGQCIGLAVKAGVLMLSMALLNLKMPCPVQDSSFLHSIETDSGAHPALCPMSTRGSFSGGVKWHGREVDHSPPSSAEIKKGGAIPPLHSMFLWHNA
jgi:hypothetical protein